MLYPFASTVQKFSEYKLNLRHLPLKFIAAVRNECLVHYYGEIKRELSHCEHNTTAELILLVLANKGLNWKVAEAKKRITKDLLKMRCIVTHT